MFVEALHCCAPRPRALASVFPDTWNIRIAPFVPINETARSGLEW